MGYAEAIEQQMRALRYWRHPDSHEHAIWWMAGRDGRHEMRTLREQGRAYHPTPEMEANAASLRKTLTGSLAVATPFFVGAPICDVVRQAGSTLPQGAMLAPGLLPEQTGFVWFEKPLPLLDDLGVQAVLWDVVGGEHPGVGMVAFDLHVASQAVVPLPVTFHPWAFGLTCEDDIGYPEQNSFRQAPSFAAVVLLRRYFLALLQFMAQQILAVSQRPILNKGARRRIAKVLPHEPRVRVVELRRREYQRHDESQARPVEWSCQWIVRGHWVNQFHPSTGEHKPLWRMPHLKGDPSKPLKVPQITAYEVRR